MKDEITSFICGNYCQFCGNEKCDVNKIMEKYQTNWLTAKQMTEVKEFQLDKVACRNHIPDEGFTMFGHKILIYYTDGRSEKKRGWFSTKEISELWNENKSIDYVEIIFSDL